MTIKEAILLNYLFRGLSDEQIEQINAIGEKQEYAVGQVMIRQFDRSSDLMIITSGSALIKAFSGEVLAEVGIGSVVGEVSLIDEQPRSATVVCGDDCEVLVLKGPRLHALMDRDASFKATLLGNLGKLLCQRLRAANIQLDAALASAARVQSRSAK